jgi:cofilin
MTTVGEGTLELFNAIKLGKTKRWAVFKITKTHEIVEESSGDRKEEYDSFVRRLPGSNCRFAIYDLEFRTASDKRATSKVFFFMWTPENANDLDRVAYTQALVGFREKCPGTFYVQVETKEEVADHLQLECRE